jgi:hypothetical protein
LYDLLIINIDVRLKILFQARNIYVGQSDVIKMDGFGLVKNFQDNDLIIDEKSQFSIKSTAPEVPIKMNIQRNQMYGILVYFS